MSMPKKVSYKMVETTEYLQEGGAITAYGIHCTEETTANGEHKEVLIPGISTRMESVKDFVRKLTLYQADPIHLQDLIEDYLT